MRVSLLVAASIGLVQLACTPLNLGTSPTPTPTFALGQTIQANIHQQWSSTSTIAETKNPKAVNSLSSKFDLTASLRLTVQNETSNQFTISAVVSSFRINSASASGETPTPAPWTLTVDSQGHLTSGHLWVEVGGTGPVDGLDQWSAGFPSDKVLVGQKWTQSWDRTRQSGSSLHYQATSMLESQKGKDKAVNSALSYKYQDSVDQQLQEHRTATVQSTVNSTFDPLGRPLSTTCSSSFQSSDGGRYTPEQQTTTGTATFEVSFKY
jgi:hypothetical protein